jgi:hypothetical protein
MPKKLRADLRQELDNLIAEWGLHDRPDEPVVIEPCLEAYRAGYRRLWGRREAVTYHWQRHDIDYHRVVYDVGLRELSASARKRRAGAHELCHIIAGHLGTEFIVGARRGYCVGVGRRLSDWQEEEAELGCAYLLVPTASLVVWESYDVPFIARKLDTPFDTVIRRLDLDIEIVERAA